MPAPKQTAADARRCDSNALPPIPWWFDVLAALRTPLILFTVIPLSFIVDMILMIRNTVFFYCGQAPARHRERVCAIQEKVKLWHSNGRKKLLCTSRSAAAGMNTRMPDFKEQCNKIDVSMLQDVLNIDEANMSITMEPLCNMGYVSRFLVPRGLALQCLPEMDDLTIGGLVCGYGVSTQSHRYGTMQDAVLAVELVLPSGELVKATAENEHADLFRCIPWSHGTLGILVSVTIRMIRVKPYVRMEYLPCYSMGQLEENIGSLIRGKSGPVPDFLEATLYSPTTSVIQAGYLCHAKECPDIPINHISRWYKPWFFKHVESVLQRGTSMKELLPLRDYYHRHTKSIYWEFEDMVPFGNHPVYRWLLGWLGAPKVSLVKATQGVAVRRATLYKHVCQEVMVPLDKLSQTHDLYLHQYNTYPLLLYIIRVYDYGCKERPTRATHGQGFIRAPSSSILEPGSTFAYFAELGAYGVPAAVRRNSYWDACTAIRHMESFARDEHGYQCLCFDTLQSREEFMTMFDHRLWDKVRKEYRLEDAFPDVYTKVRPEKGVV